MPSTLFYTLSSGVAGAFISAWFAYLFSIRQVKKQQEIAAKAQIKAAFAPLIAKMKLAQVDSTCDKKKILVDTLPEIATAVEIFRPFVNAKKRSDFQKAWEGYYSNEIDGKVHFAKYCFDITENNKKTEGYSLFTDKVNHLLSFAD